MDAVGSSETLVSHHITAGLHIPEDLRYLTLKLH